MGPGTLDSILHQLPKFESQAVLIGLGRPDDAGVYCLNSELALIQTLDFFTPVVDDPYRFGQIAAANALSDVYAMGGKPLTAMNIVCFPASCLDIQILAEILKGGAERVRQAGAVLLGGHTVEDPEPKYGLSVTGIVHPQAVVSNQGARPGDVLVLTKPLGTGVLMTALKGEVLSEADLQPAVDSMIRLNKAAAESMRGLGVSAATDVTGFGFLGHAYEMVAGSGVTFEFSVGEIPWLPQAREMAQMGLIPAGAYSNRRFMEDQVVFADNVAGADIDLLYDPQTSGGLLIAIPESQASELLNRLQAHGETGWVVGRVGPAVAKPIMVCG